MLAGVDRPKNRAHHLPAERQTNDRCAALKLRLPVEEQCDALHGRWDPELSMLTMLKSKNQGITKAALGLGVAGGGIHAALGARI
jgi:hypothetical protein